MIKQIIAFLFALFMVVSCVTPSQSFLAKKHKVYDRNVMVIEETKVASPYSPYFETKELMEFTKNSITKETKAEYTYLMPYVRFAPALYSCFHPLKVSGLIRRLFPTY